jgi:hypothetical protein
MSAVLYSNFGADVQDAACPSRSFNPDSAVDREAISKEQTFRSEANDGSKRSTASLRSTAAPRGSVQNVLSDLNDLNDLNGSEATIRVSSLLQVCSSLTL